MNTLRALFRLAGFLVLACALILDAWFHLRRFPEDIGYPVRARHRMARRMLKLLGVRIQASGAPPDFPCLIVSNHRSYIDPAVPAVDIPVYAVAKAEVGRWPVIGLALRLTGTLLLQRENNASRQYTLQAIGEKIREGFQVILFPEGTTQAHPATIDFRPGGFRLAASEGFPIVPIAMDYRDPDDYWVGDDQFLNHFLRCFGKPETLVGLHYGPALRSHDPDVLRRDAQTWIDRELSIIQKSF